MGTNHRSLGATLSNGNAIAPFLGSSSHKRIPMRQASAQHDAWSADKVINGWKYGTEKNADLKTHPCLVSFEELPEFQRAKDVLFKAIVNALT
jgi:hypothetical protein